MGTNNSTHANAVTYPPAIEFGHYEDFPEVVRKVIREAPFNLSCADMKNNRPVMKMYHSLGPNKFAVWLEAQLKEVYATKISA